MGSAQGLRCHCCWEAGCRDFFVTYVSEAAEIIDLVPPASISLLHGPLNPADAAWARGAGVSVVINSPEQATRWIEAGGGVCDVMVDSGINRLGLPMAALGDPLSAAARYRRADVAPRFRR